MKRKKPRIEAQSARVIFVLHYISVGTKQHLESVPGLRAVLALQLRDNNVVASILKEEV